MNNGDKRQKGELGRIRHEMGAAILENIKDSEDLPVKNIVLLSKVMQKNYKEGNYKNEYEEIVLKSRWKPTAKYWKAHMADIRKILRDKNHLYLEFLREQGELKGIWTFVNEAEYLTILKRDYQTISKIIENYTDRKNDGDRDYVLPIPSIAKVKRLTYGL